MNKSKSHIGKQENITSSFPVYFTNIEINKFDQVSNFPASSILISSPVDTDGNDIDTPAVGISDSEGNLLPLSYTMDMTYFKFAGNKLVLDTDKVISNNLSYFVDNKYLTVNNGKITINGGELVTYIRNNFDTLYVAIQDKLKKDYNLTPQQKSPVTLPPMTISPVIRTTVSPTKSI